MKSILAALAAALAFTGCASIGDGKLDVKGAIKSEIIDALDKIADNKLIARAAESARLTLAWVKAEEAKTPPMEPLKAALARACPNAVNAATADLRQKIERLKGLLGPDSTDPGLLTGYLIFDLTRLKYGSKALDPKAEIEQVKADIGLRIDAIMTGCLHLAPTEQAKDLLKLMARAGIATQTGGMLGGL